MILIIFFTMAVKIKMRLFREISGGKGVVFMVYISVVQDPNNARKQIILYANKDNCLGPSFRSKCCLFGVRCECGFSKICLHISWNIPDVGLCVVSAPRRGSALRFTSAGGGRGGVSAWSCRECGKSQFHKVIYLNIYSQRLGTNF